jgi:hypothetical protein
MLKTVQIRNVPDRIYCTMVRRAKQKGISLSEYLRQIAMELAARPTMDEMRERLASLPEPEAADTGRATATSDSDRN